jgi:hypothetical protein
VRKVIGGFFSMTFNVHRRTTGRLDLNQARELNYRR